MPSFDVVSEVDHHELKNAIDQAGREVSTRFDFKGSGSHFTHADKTITMHAQAEFQLQQMLDILRKKMAARSIDLYCLQENDPIVHMKKATQVLTIDEGIDAMTAKRLVKMIKDEKLKVQTTIQDQQLRITGKKRDDLQQVIALLKGADLKLPLQYQNFRD